EIGSRGVDGKKYGAIVLGPRPVEHADYLELVHHRIRFASRCDRSVEEITDLALLILRGFESDHHFIHALGRKPPAVFVAGTLFESEPWLHRHVARHINATDD